MNNQLNKALVSNKLLLNVDVSEIDLSGLEGEVFSKQAGEVIYREGEAANAIYLVISGEINLMKKKGAEQRKPLVIGTNGFFGNYEFFEEPARLSTAVALKDTYLLKLTEEDVQKLIQQDTMIYENLRHGMEDGLPEENSSVAQDADSDLDEIDLALKLDSQLQGISIDGLSDSEPEIEPGNVQEKIAEPEPDKEFIINKSNLIDDDILKALENEDAFSAIESTSEDQPDLTLNDEDFFKTFSSDISEIETEPVKSSSEFSPPPVVPPSSGKKSANNLIDFNFGDEKDNLDDIFGDDKEISEEIDRLMSESSGDAEQEPDTTKLNLENENSISDNLDKSEKTAEIKIDTKNSDSTGEKIPEPAEILKAGKRKEDELMTAEELELINKAAQLVNSNIQLDEVLHNIVDVASNLTHADRGTLYIVDKESNELWSKILMGDNVKEVRLKIGEGVAGWVAKSKEVVNIENVREDTRFQPAVDKNTGYETKSMLCFPIKNRESEVIGVLQLLNSGNGVFSKMDEEFLNALSIHAALALENASMVQKLLQSERVDSLGKMANFLIQDIKKPVLVSKRYAEHLRAKDLPQEIIQVLDMMLEQMNAVADLVQTTSSYAEGKKILHTIDVGLSTTLMDYSSRMEQYVQLKTCTIVNNIDTKAKVRLDVKEFFQCYSHIVKNACDAMPDGGRITVYVDEKDNKVSIHMVDEGLGIPDTIKEKIFEPFTTHGKKEGTGLGLAITKKIVESHGGSITVDSTLGEGATFTITLPKV